MTDPAQAEADAMTLRNALASVILAIDKEIIPPEVASEVVAGKRTIASLANDAGDIMLEQAAEFEAKPITTPAVSEETWSALAKGSRELGEKLKAAAVVLVDRTKIPTWNVAMERDRSIALHKLLDRVAMAKTMVNVRAIVVERHGYTPPELIEATSTTA